MKKILSIFLAFTLCIYSLPNIIANAELPQEDVQVFLNNYFNELYQTLLEDSVNDFNSDDFNSINGYIIAKHLVATREMYKELMNGICNVNIREVTLEDLIEKAPGLEAMVYVKYEYAYDDGSPENQDVVGNLFRVSLAISENSYIVTDLDTTDIDIQQVKDSLVVAKTRNLESNFDAVDSYYKQIEKNTQSLLELEPTSFAEPEEEKPEKVSRTSVSFNVDKARNWGYKLGEHEQNYVFQRVKYDCTNFISQCIWAGYGGANGYNIPTSPSYSNATCVALKNRVKADYRMTKQWFGRNYDSTAGDPPATFINVVAFYDYVTTNNGNGPKATAYNNNKIYTSLTTDFRKADVLQVYSANSGRYFHSMIVSTPTTYSVANYTKVKVAQHQGDRKNRPLSEIVDWYGGSSCKIRLLRFKSATF